MNLEDRAIEEIETASRLFRETENKFMEHFSLAWLYEKFANKYYNLGDYYTSGKYAEISGNEYIEASKNTGEESKRLS